MRNLVLIHRKNEHLPDTVANLAFVLMAEETIWIDSGFLRGGKENQEILREIRSLLDEVYEKLDNLIEN